MNSWIFQNQNLLSKSIRKSTTRCYRTKFTKLQKFSFFSFSLCFERPRPSGLSHRWLRTRRMWRHIASATHSRVQNAVNVVCQSFSNRSVLNCIQFDFYSWFVLKKLTVTASTSWKRPTSGELRLVSFVWWRRLSDCRSLATKSRLSLLRMELSLVADWDHSPLLRASPSGTDLSIARNMEAGTG